MSNASYESQVPCPQCGTKKIQTVVTYPYARGMLLAMQYGKKRFAGCVDCAASELRKESGRQLLYGWFSPMALIATLGLVPWNFFRSFSVKPNKKKVLELFAEIGMPVEAAETVETNIAQSLYAAIAAMILADGKIDDKELETARSVSTRLIPNFDAAQLDAYLKRPALPVAQIGALLKPALSAEDKELLITILVEIAHGDADYDESEEAMLRGLADALGAPMTAYARIGSAAA